MIIIENTTGKTPAEVRAFLIMAAAAASSRNPMVWLHVEKEGREAAVNTDDDPIRPGVLAYGEDSYNDVGIDMNQDNVLTTAWLDALQELGL